MILQPKRWERAEDPRFDPIRHKPWFARLLKRKHVIPMMEGCYKQWMREDALTQDELCSLWNVSPREFRDYVKLRTMDFDLRDISKEFQSILDSAYRSYCIHNACRPIQRFIADFSPLYGKNYRHVWEMWEVNPVFYPNDYPHRN